jgi:uncharacterized protein
MRTLLILIAIVVVVLVLRRMLATPRQASRSGKRVGHMVQCAHCGMYIPEAEAIHHQGHDYCSIAHRDAGHT